MASPFSVFRKRQKFLMALACLLAIVAFVFLPNMGKVIGDKSRGAQNAVVITTSKFGNLRESNLRRMRDQRQKVRTVLIELGQRAGANPANVERVVDSLIGSATEQAVVDTWLKARYAEQLGMVVSDDTINSFLKQWTGNVVKPEDIDAAFKRTPPVSAIQFFEMMREELLARQFSELFFASVQARDSRGDVLPIATPGQRWDYYNRLHRTATIEAIPLAVADYVKDVSDPNEEELKTFFKENKETTPYPESPDPGFRVPHKVAFEYFKANLDKFAEKVTDAEVLSRYEKKKDYYDQAFKKPPVREPIKLEGPKEKPIKMDGLKGTKGVKDGILPKAPGDKSALPGDKSLIGGDKVRPEAKPEPKKVKDSGKPSVPADVKKEPKEPARTEPKGPDKAKDAKGNSSADRSSPFRLTSMLVDEKSDEKDAKAPAKAASPVKPESPAKVATPPKSEVPAKHESPTVKEDPKAKEPAKTKEQKPAAAAALSPEEQLEEMPAEMKKQIRREIAFERIVKVFEALRKPMDEYQKKRREYDLEVLRLKHDKKESPAPPPEPNFEKLAKENGISATRTGSVPQWEAAKLGIGTWMPAEIVNGDFGIARGARVLLSAYQSPVKFRPAVAFDGDACYLYWKSEDEKEYTPKFEDARKDILRVWKLIHARSFAKKAAEALAAEANRADKPLKTLFAKRPELRVLEPAKFSWMTLGNVAFRTSQGAEICPVTDVPMAGEDFMKTVFRLEPGKVGVAFNAPQTIVYVVRPSQFVPPYEVRWAMFPTDDFGNYAPIGLEDRNRTIQAWLKELQTSAGFEWAAGRKPDHRETAERRESGSGQSDDDD